MPGVGLKKKGEDEVSCSNDEQTILRTVPTFATAHLQGVCPVPGVLLVPLGQIPLFNWLSVRITETKITFSY